MTTFQPATQATILPSVALVGLPGDGKTFTGLQLAIALAGPDGKVAVIDTERSASIYSEGNPFHFDVVNLKTFAPQQFIDLIAAAEKKGYDALLIDCLSDEYISKDGVLDIVHGKKNKQQGWGDATPPHSRLISAISTASIPIVATVGARIDDSGNMKPVQRDDMMRAFHVGFDVSKDGLVVAHKTRYAALPLGKRFNRDGAVIAPLLASGVDEKAQLRRQKMRFIEEIAALYGDDGFKDAQDVAGLLSLAGVEEYDPENEEMIFREIAAYIDSLRNGKKATARNGKGKAQDKGADENQDIDQPDSEQPSLFEEPDTTKDAIGQ